MTGFWTTFVLILAPPVVPIFYDGSFCDDTKCECLQGPQPCCNAKALEDYNADRVVGLVSGLMRKTYFRYHKVNINKKCQFWPDERQCVLKNCNVDTCSSEELPPAFKPNMEDTTETCSIGADLPLHNVDKDLSQEQLDVVKRLGDLDKSIEFIDQLDFEGENVEYIDLEKNPERYTGYAGQGAAKIWRSIFLENCLAAQPILKRDRGTCLEYRVLTRILSGFRSSVAIHLSSSYPISVTPFKTTWGTNFEELWRRFSPQTTGGQGTEWIHNFFFAYSIVQRALLKALPAWKIYNFRTGRPDDDLKTKATVLQLLDRLNNTPGTFREQVMFQNLSHKLELVKEIQTTVQNISKILDCVACDKCRLWGKIQIHGYGTALKVLLTPTNGRICPALSPAVRLNRMEIVSLFNLFARLSNSLNYLKLWRKHLEGSTHSSESDL